MAKTIEPKIQAVCWNQNVCEILDQTLLPFQIKILSCKDYREVIDAIQRLAVRGAPAIGIAGAYAVVLAYQEALKLPSPKAELFWKEACIQIAHARPTAVNLSWAVQKMRLLVPLDQWSVNESQKLLNEATKIHQEDIEANRKMARLGSDLLTPGKAVLTYCNTGDLATGGIGTAFGVIHQGFIDGKISHVYACETRPVLQGARLTAWELQQNAIPFSLICDNMAGMLMSQGKISAVILGSDRITARGDVANKIGSYSLAVLAKYHDIPFIAVAPVSTFDLSLENALQVPIEQRAAEEVTKILGPNHKEWNISVYNPSFDVTPHVLVSAIVCEKGVIENPNREHVNRVLGVGPSMI